MDKHHARVEFFRQKIEELSTEMNFNFSDDAQDSVAFLTDYADRVKKRYVRAGAVKEYGFTIIVTKSYSPYGDDVNLQAMTFAQDLMDWVEEKNRAKQYPEFPDTCTIQKIEPLQNMPNLSGVNMEQLVARYMFQCRVTYYESEVRK